MKILKNKRKLKPILLILLVGMLGISQVSLIAQTVKGKVTAADGASLPGVNISEKGTNIGTVTDINGEYQIDASKENAVLQFSYVGFLTEEVEVAGRSEIDVSLIEDIQSLEEIVVIGYGTRRKKDLTGAVSMVTSEELNRETKMSPELALQGKVAGVYISNPGSDPTSRPTVRIRGVGTLGFNDPLYVVDGVPLTEGGASGDGRISDMRGDVNVLSLINPNDIESISVLKDASATAIYGVRASNGVILIQTKRGQSGKPKIDFSARYGVQNIYKRYDVMSVEQYTEAHLEAWENNPSAQRRPEDYRFYDPESPDYLGNSPSYTEDWINEGLVKNAPLQDYNLSISGGNQASNYALGIGYSDQENVVAYSNYKRYSFYLNSDHQLADWLKVGESYRFAYSNNDEKGSTGKLDNTSFVPPWQPLYEEDAENGMNGWALPGRVIDSQFVNYGYGPGTKATPGGAEYVNNVDNLMRNLGTFYAEASPFDGFRIRGTFSFDYYTRTSERYEGADRGYFIPSMGEPYNTGNTYRKRDNVNSNIVTEFLIGYNKSFGQHNIDLVLNAMQEKINWDFEQKAISNNSPIPNWDQRRIDEGWPADDKSLFYERRPTGLIGYMGRLSYNYAYKYYIDATVRRDGSSKFGPGYKWGTFPSFAAAWRISSESFMQNVGWINDLKFRGGWGQTGNQETRDFAFLSLVNFNPKYSLGEGAIPGDGVIVPAAALGDFPIKDMSWETSTTINFGFDGVFLANKLSLTAEYYNRITEGILQEIDIPLVIGASSKPVINLATVENSGFEFVTEYKNTIGPIGYSVSANLTTVKNMVKDLYRNRPSGGDNDRIEEGYPIKFLYGYKTDGIFQTQEEVDAYLEVIEDRGNSSKKGPGDVIFRDIGSAPAEEDGEDVYRSAVLDSSINSFDQTYIGKTIPGYYYGINLSMDYKNWDMNINLQGVGDVQKFYRRGKNSIDPGGNNFVTDYLDRWTPDNPSSTIPRAIADDPSGNNRTSDRHVEEAGFIRLRNIQVGYTFNSALLGKIGASNMRVYLSGSNLFVITPFPDLDPEDITTPVTFLVGANLSF